jgi:type IV pilus assembly protein PilA
MPCQLGTDDTTGAQPMHRHRDGRTRPRGEGGFTLVELLVVVVVIGILIAVAVPLYLKYKQGASDKSAASDLRAAVSVLEKCYSDNGVYPSALASTGGTPTGCSGVQVNLSSATTVSYYPKSATDFTAFVIGATNTKGASKTYCYQSTVAGAITTTSTAVTAYRAAC